MSEVKARGALAGLGSFRIGCIVLSSSRISPIEVFASTQCDEGIGTAEHTEDANFVVVFELQTRYHCVCIA